MKFIKAAGRIIGFAQALYKIPREHLPQLRKSVRAAEVRAKVKEYKTLHLFLKSG